MKLSIAIKRLIAAACFQTGLVLKRLQRLSKNGSLILMYHRVLPKGEACKGVQSGMYVEPITLEMHIRFLKKFTAIAALSKAPETIRSNNTRQCSQPTCFLTFDDGWSDFYDYAFPIIQKHGVPATVFLPTDFIGTEKWFWTDRLAHMLLNAKVSWKTQIRSLPPAKNKVVNTIETLSGSEDSILETAIELLKGQSVDEIENALSEFSQRWEVVNKPEGRAFLTWKEVGKMGQSGLISYGSHTVKHKILTRLKDQEVCDELERSKKELIERCAVSPSFIPFCYPNGNHNDRVAMLVKEAGYHLAVTTKHGYNRFGCYSFKLSRIGVHQDVSSTMGMYGCRLTSLI